MADDKRRPLPVSFEHVPATDPDQVGSDVSTAAHLQPTQVKMRPLPPDAALELAHLLVRVAWIDLELTATEWVAVLHIAASLGLNTDELAQISGELAGDLPIPSPNLKLLAQHKEAVLAAAQKVINADNELSPVEEEFFRNLSLTLNRQG